MEKKSKKVQGNTTGMLGFLVLPLLVFFVLLHGALLLFARARPNSTQHKVARAG